MAMCTSETFTQPPEWSDSERMRFLLSPFPPNVIVKYDEPKVKFWRSLIISSCKQLKKITFTENQLVDRFCWNTSRPRCLGPILDAMERHGDILKKTDLINTSESWMRWSVNVLSKSVSWLMGSPKTQSCAEYVLQDAVKEVSEAIMLEHQRGIVYQNTDHVMLGTEYRHLCEKFVAPECFDIVAVHMLRQGKIVQSAIQGDIQVVKFIPTGHGGVVSETDLQLVHLKQAILKMSTCVKNLQDEINRLQADALSKHREHDKSAVGILRRAKTRAAMLQKREMALDNLNGILERIQAAETDKMILNAYKEGLDALKKMRLDEEAVAVVMDELQEVMQDHEHINQSIAQDVTDVAGMEEEGDLLKELEELLSASQEQDNHSTLEETFSLLKISSPPREKEELSTPLKEKKSQKAEGGKQKLVPQSPVLS